MLISWRSIICLLPLMLAWQWSCAAVALALGERVILVRSDTSSVLVEQATVFARGELVAARFDVSMLRVPSPTTRPPLRGVASLALLDAPNAVRVVTIGPDGDTRFEQVIGLDADDITPEVIAVRAVEALRATLLRYARKARAQEKEISNVVRDFARLEDSALPPARRSEVVAPPELGAIPQPDEPGLAFLAGPTMAFLAGRLTPLVAGRLGASLRSSRLAAEIMAEGSVVSAALRGEGGNVEIGRDALLANASVRFPVGASWRFSGNLGFGVARYSLESAPNDGFDGPNDGIHEVALAFLGVSAEYWITRNWGTYLATSLQVVGDAWVVRVAGHDVARIEQPGGLLSLGLIFGKR